MRTDIEAAVITAALGAFARGVRRGCDRRCCARARWSGSGRPLGRRPVGARNSVVRR